MGEPKDLAQIIRDNPGCVAEIDNDCWCLYSAHEWAKSEADDIDDIQQLANSDDNLVRRGDGYGSGPNYGGDLLQALATIVGMRIESV